MKLFKHYCPSTRQKNGQRIQCLRTKYGHEFHIGIYKDQLGTEHKASWADEEPIAFIHYNFRKSGTTKKVA